MLIKETIDGGKAFDFGRTSEDYTKYRDLYPQQFYSAVIGAGLCTKGQTVLDLGTGTGVLPRNLCAYGARFVGADVSLEQIRQEAAVAGAGEKHSIDLFDNPESTDFRNIFLYGKEAGRRNPLWIARTDDAAGRKKI